VTDRQPAFIDIDIPGGIITPGGWEPLAMLADTHADSRLHLTESGLLRLYTAGSAGVLLDALTADGLSPAANQCSAGEGEIGWLTQADGLVHLGAALPLGTMSAQMARMLDVIEAPVVLCRDRVLRIEGLSESIAEQVVRVLAPQGLIFDINSPLLAVSACVGAAQCGLSLSDVRGDALQAATSGALAAGHTHFVGCGRRCGAPARPHTEYLATGDGEYEVSG
jgi:precorrin-3B synthase